MSTAPTILESLANPAARHAALVHTPIAISALAVPAAVALACTKARSDTLRWACVALLAIGTITAWLAEEAGEAAVNELDTATFTVDIIQTLETHEQMGERVWLLFAAATAACALTALKKPPARIAALVATVALTLTLAAYVAVTAHHGGTLVYHHAVGVPTQPNN